MQHIHKHLDHLFILPSCLYIRLGQPLSRSTCTQTSPTACLHNNHVHVLPDQPATRTQNIHTCLTSWDCLYWQQICSCTSLNQLLELNTSRHAWSSQTAFLHNSHVHILDWSSHWRTRHIQMLLEPASQQIPGAVGFSARTATMLMYWAQQTRMQHVK